jgi:hypothetical protein
MTSPHAVILLALLCGSGEGPGRWDMCEEAEIRAATCDAAEAWLRAGMRHGQTLRVLSCEAVP